MYQAEVLQLQRWGSGRVSGWGLAGEFCSRSDSSLPRLSSPACDGRMVKIFITEYRISLRNLSGCLICPTNPIFEK